MHTIRWRKSSYSNDNGQCVELAERGGLLRDSKNPSGSRIRVPSSAARIFVEAAKSGLFDR